METNKQPARQRATLADVARAAGVGEATVDRVLNERGGVAVATVERVVAAARELGLRRLLPVPYRRRLRLVVILQRPNLFYRSLSAAFQRVGALLDPAITVERRFVDSVDPAVLARAITDASALASGLVVVPLDGTEVATAIAAASARGLPVVTLLSDVPGSGRIAYVGIDNVRAGRLAGYLLGRLNGGRPGSALVLVGSRAYAGHREREAGFRAVLAARFPALALAATVEGADEDETSRRVVHEALGVGPGVVAVYSTGGGNAGVIDALAARGGKERVLFIGHELTEQSRKWLLDGVMDAVIDRSPELQAEVALRLLLHALGRLDGSPPGAVVRPEVVFAESLDAS